ncbi:SWI SNF, matrix associated, actin dependent regulator of chromatin, sub c, member 2 [Trapelia coarctata]|nr:SWI SNF, matrix associated, actin dependent regulator of chromatin, sub c, member 2 [Trapelia coarctata]
MEGVPFDMSGPLVPVPAEPSANDPTTQNNGALNTLNSAAPKIEASDPSTVTPPILDTSQAQPPPISDNPLDAPDAPRPEEEDDDREDEEMAGMDDIPKDENESPEKDGEEVQSSQQADGVAERQSLETKAAVESSAKAHLVAQNFSIVLPSYSTWFDMHVIHAIEKKALPEFFNNRNRSKTPAVYKDYRDFMINTYRLNPGEYLTVTACRRNLAGDVCAIMRVHAFLEQWGLINYQVDPDARPSVIGPPFTGHFLVTTDNPRGLSTFQPHPKTEKTPGKALARTEQAANATPLRRSELTNEGRRDIFDRTGKNLTPAAEKQANGEGSSANGTADPESVTKAVEEMAKEPKKVIYCLCCGLDCTRARWHNSRATAVPGSKGSRETYDICPKCYSAGTYPKGQEPKDFVLHEDISYSSVPDRDAPWSETELLLLLEGLEMFDENWVSIADHVGTRTREECVLKFLQLEIDDKYLEDGMGSDNYVALNTGRLPFTKQDNPVLSVVSFLAGMSGPNVTAALTDRSVKEMLQAQREQFENGTIGKAFQSQSKDKEAVKNEDSMEVDDSSSPQLVDTNQVAVSQSERSGSASYSAIAMAASAARAATLASHEEREMTRLVSAAVNTALQKFELKLSQFAEMEAVLQAERQDLERARQQLFLDRLSFKKRVREIQDGLRKLGIPETLGDAGENKLGMFSVTGRSEEDARPLGAGDEGYRSIDV